jgi:predicted DNA-binding transcriptional regulator YafY
MDQPKLDRLLRLMKMLTCNNSYTVKDLSDRLGMTVRTVYRYIDTFREAGFVIKKRGNFTRIDRSSPYLRDISSLVHFTEEEAYILKSAIESIDENNLIKQNLKRKLYTVYDYRILAETIVKGKNARNVNGLVEAMEERRQVILRNYSSANSHVVRDRLVEPFAFTTNYIQIWAYETETGQNKLFKLSRVAKVEVLPQPWEHEQEHQTGYIDIFRISSHRQYPVKLSMGLRAASLLTEEYPLSEKYLVRVNDNEWLLETQVCSYEGIGRFVIGLLNDIRIIDSPEFADFIRKRIELYHDRLNKL